METKSLERLSILHPKERDRAIDAYNEAVKLTPIGVHPYITESFRSFGRSDELYKLGRTVVNPDGRSSIKPMGNIVSYAKGGQSLHNYYLAFDFMLQINGRDSWVVDANWMVVVKIFKAHGFEWGGDWKGKKKDMPHFQMTFGYSVKQLRDKYYAGDFIPNTHYLNI